MSKAVMKQALDAMLKGYAGLNFEAYSAAVGSLQAAIANPEPSKFNIGDMVKKRSGSEWAGKVVGHYSTTLTPAGCCVESSSHAGSVQIYPESTLNLRLKQPLRSLSHTTSKRWVMRNGISGCAKTSKGLK